MVLATAIQMLTYILQSWKSSRTAITARPSYFERRWQQYVLYSSLFSSFRAQRRHPFPARSHSLIAGGYVLLALALSLASYAGRLFNNNTSYTNESTQIIKYLADRSAIMAVSQLPFLFLFAGRKNSMLWLTGWSFKTFNLYHKWVGRVMWVLVLIYAITYTVSYIWTSRYSSGAVQTYFMYGIVAVSAGGIIMVQLSRLFRSRAYEIFLVIHIILAAVFILTVWYHHADKHHPESMPFIYCSIALWAIDLGVRLIRVLHYNVGVKMTSTADITVISSNRNEDPILLINIHTPRAVTPNQGQYIFLHLRDVYPWQAHPFTIMDHDPTTNTLHLAAKVHDGVTRPLYNHVTRHTTSALDGKEKGHNATITSSRNLHVAIDGLYSTSAAPEIALYDTVLLVAGGAGITAVYPYLRYLVQNPEAQTKHVRLVWIVRHSPHLEMLRPQLEELRAEVLEILAVDVELFTTPQDPAFPPTSGGDRSPTPSPSNGKVPTHSATPLTSIQYKTTRPSIPQLILSAIHDAPSSIAVLACGPEGLVEAVREAVYKGLEQAKGSVGWFDEGLGW